VPSLLRNSGRQLRQRLGQFLNDVNQTVKILVAALSENIVFVGAYESGIAIASGKPPAVEIFKNFDAEIPTNA
jgi:hypothetical protein